MSTLPYLALLLFVYLVGIAGWKLASFRHISLPGFYVLMSFLPVLAILPLGDWAAEFEMRPGYDDYLNAIVIHALALFGGLSLAYVACGFSRAEREHFFSDLKQKRVPATNSDTLFFLLGAAFVVTMFIDQIVSLRTLPILTLLDGSFTSADLAIDREESFKLNESDAVFLWHLSRQIIVPTLLAMAFVWMMRKISLIRIAAFGLILVFGAVNNSLNSALAPVATLFLIIFLCYVNSARKIKLYKAFIISFMVMIFPVFVVLFSTDLSIFDSVAAVSENILQRFSIETFDRTLSYFDVFPYVHDYLGGATNKLFMIFSGQDFFNAQNYVFIYRLDELKPHLLDGYANAHFIGYMNADFGLAGVAISSFVVGVILALFDVVITRLPKQLMTYAIYAVTTTLFWKLMGTQPTTILVSHGAILLLLIGLVFTAYKPSRAATSPSAKLAWWRQTGTN